MPKKKKRSDNIKIKHKNNNKWNTYTTTQPELLNDIMCLAVVDKHNKPIQCIYDKKHNRIDVLYMTNEDDRHIQWGWRYLIYQVDTKDWMKLLIQYANKRTNKLLISFVYKEVDKIP